MGGGEDGAGQNAGVHHFVKGLMKKMGGLVNFFIISEGTYRKGV